MAAVVIATHSSSWSNVGLGVVTNRPLILKCEVRVLLSAATSPPEVVQHLSHYSLGYPGLYLCHTFCHGLIDLSGGLHWPLGVLVIFVRSTLGRTGPQPS